MPYKDKAIAAEKKKAYNRTYRAKHAVEIKASRSTYVSTHSNEISAYNSARGQHLKVSVLTHYGAGVLKCSLCPEKRIGALTLDHVGGCGNLYNGKCGRSSKGLYSKVMRQGYPIGYRTLCSNCNVLSYLADRTLSQDKKAISVRSRVAALKRSMMDVLGGKCVECDADNINILTVHHVNDDGKHHRDVVAKGCAGYKFYRAVLATMDLDGLECRCFSCNDAAAWSVQVGS